MTETKTDPIIRLRGIKTAFGREVIHDGVDLDVYRGEVLGLVGGSGTGKSVLLKHIIGLTDPSSGKIEVFGADISDDAATERNRLRQRWGVLFQEGALFSSMTVAENIQVPIRELSNLPLSLMDDVARIKISMVGLPPDTFSKTPAQLSGGMKKRAGLARAMALDPEILFLDEPTAGLDPISATQFDELIKSLKENHSLTVVMVTHDLDSLYAICDRVAVLVDKKAIVGTIDELMKSKNDWIHNYFTGPRGRAAAQGHDKPKADA